MAEEWKSIARPSEACVGCERPFRPGDELTSALYQEAPAGHNSAPDVESGPPTRVESGAPTLPDFLRRDFCPSCWEARRGGDEFSFWRHVVPEPEEAAARKKRRLDAMLNPAVLFDIFKEMADHPDAARRRFRFVLALMLMRRKKLRFLSIGRKRMADGEQDVLVVKQAGRGARLAFDVVDVRMGEEEMVAAQDEVEKVLAMGGVEVAVPGRDAAGPSCESRPSC